MALQNSTKGYNMPKINRYQDISQIDREAKKDLIDRHSPFIHCEATAKAGEPFEVTVKMGNEYTHPDDFDHYIESVTLYDGDRLLARASYVPGTLGNTKAHNTTTFTIIPTGKKLNLVAHGYCTKHGIWEGESVAVEVVE
jgi:superoxide reductase